MSSSWTDLSEGKVKRNIIRERLEQKRKERQDNSTENHNLLDAIKSESVEDTKLGGLDVKPEIVPDAEDLLLQLLSDSLTELPVTSTKLHERLEQLHQLDKKPQEINTILQKLSDQNLVVLEILPDGDRITAMTVVSVNAGKISSSKGEITGSMKRKFESDGRTSEDESTKKLATNDIMSLLSMPSTLEKQNKEVGVEILELLSKPTAKERSLAEKFKSQGGAQVHEFCPHGTKSECNKALQSSDELPEEAAGTTTPLTSSSSALKEECLKLHFKKIIQSHTDENLGDCSFLNTCFHMDSCKYVHYEVDSHQSVGSFAIQKIKTEAPVAAENAQKFPQVKRPVDPENALFPAQWIQCDLRYLDMTVLGKFSVVMADPPWDIHMELPYGTMSDDEMRQLGVPALQDDGLIFLWVTGRAMELGRECLKLWGYERVDELIWVKTNQLQRIIRTGRTGHWLNHGKEHCLVGMKGSPKNLNRGLDCDVIVAEVRATSHKPDEIYGIIERLSPGTRKIELFGRPHNVQPNWITLGNQLDGIRLVDPELVNQFRKRYPDGNCMAPATKSA